MKLFENQEDDYRQYMEVAMLSKKVELECIFGSKPSKNPIDKKYFYL